MKATEKNSKVEWYVKLQGGTLKKATFQMCLDTFWLLNSLRFGCLNVMQTLQLKRAVDYVIFQSTEIQDKVESRSFLVMVF